ncbi:hypothetical protein SAPIO_CDS1364 [Scedosporium apiospermum]|uniref:Copper acquisition factor BIM1-like domain-containing protein n=1 Tax=Pseudallescheria apiosperma TaxID=563466 RepID=A0A084GF56_PSEDA|nr:uncharacterized protein SAPIO_CDS1364 [Scedosporium apiospermum]KEZ45968.1 hypothetical protein SAPIO_CDS1364 [Scedosporium apiospermum]
MSLKALVLFAASAAAHFGLEFPEWRADTLKASEDSGYNQRIYPCANVPGDAGNVTDWPLTGGGLKLDLHHPWSYVFVNLGLGQNASNFNISLTPQFWNTTGNGTLCVPSLPVHLDVQEGQEASIQVVTTGDRGDALYNCANIRFTANAKPFGGEECNTNGVEYYVVGAVENPKTSSGEVPEPSTQDQGSGSGSGDSNNSSGGGDSGSGAATAGFSTYSLMSAVGLAVAFVAGLTL